MKTAEEICRHLHMVVYQLTKRPEAYRFAECSWFELLRSPEYQGDGEKLEEHLRKVVPYLQAMIKAGKRNPGALKLQNLLQPDRFNADVCEALAAKPSRAGEWSDSNAAKAAPHRVATDEEIAAEREKIKGWLAKHGGRAA